MNTTCIYATKARDLTAMSTADENGWLPLHHALKDKAPLGSIKLLLSGNPAALQVADRNGVYPLHIACEFSSAKVVQFLVEVEDDVLDKSDSNGDSPLHFACRVANIEVINYLVGDESGTSIQRQTLTISFRYTCCFSARMRKSIVRVQSILVHAGIYSVRIPKL